MLKLYLDSSVFGYAANERAGDKYADANLLLRQIAAGAFRAYISEVVIAEIAAVYTKTRELLTAKISLEIEILRKSGKVTEIADEIVNKGIIHPNVYNDAVHVAYTVSNGIDILVSYNYKHLVNVVTEAKLRDFFERTNRRSCMIRTPAEVVAYDRIP